jgi:uncharacterized protein (UPF0333 family)
MIFIHSKRGQISIEFALLVATLVLSAVIVAYYLVASSVGVRNAHIDVINKTSNVAESVLSRVT